MDGEEGKNDLADEPSDVSRTSEGWEARPGGPRRDYLSYLVRLWRVGHGREAHWQASLQRPGTEEPLWFADLEELVAFLRAETGDVKRG